MGDQTSTGSVDLVNSGAPYRALASSGGTLLLGGLATMTVVTTSGAGVLTSLAPLAVMAAVGCVLFRGLADAYGAVGPIALALLVAALCWIGAVLGLGPWWVWPALAGLAAGVALPALAGHGAVSGRVVRPGTPRVLLPLPLRVPVAARRAHRSAVVVGLTAAAVLAAAVAVAGLLDTVGPVLAVVLAVALAVVALIAGAVGVRRAVGVQNPLLAAQVAGSVMGPGLAALAASVAVAALLGPSFPSWFVGSCAATAFVGVAAIALAPGRRARDTTLAPPRSRHYRRSVATFDVVRIDPARAAVVRTPDGVRRAIEAARTAGLTVRMHSTGHKAGTAPPVTGQALLKVLIDEPVTADPIARTVRIPAGTPWGDVLPTITPHGLGAAHGSSGHVGAVGYLLGGGLSAYARMIGVAANTVSSIELVLADGRQVTADRQQHSDLFWALRGGGGGLGVVTAITVDLFDLDSVVTGTAIWPAKYTAPLLRAWCAWAVDAPERITTALRIMTLPPLPGLPLGLVRRPVVLVDGSAVVEHPDQLGQARDAVSGVLGPLRAIAPPLRDTFRHASPYETAFTHMDPPLSLAQSSDSFTFYDPDSDAIERFAEIADLGERGLTCLELRQLGGALARSPGDGGAVDTFPGDYFYWGVGLHGRRSREDRVQTGLDEVRSALKPWNSGFVVPTYSPGLDRPQGRPNPGTSSRAAAIREAYDPDGVFAEDVSYRYRS